MSPEAAELFESARNGSQAEKVAALHFAKVFRHTEQIQEFEAECMDAIMHRCAATYDLGGTVLQCDRRDHDGNPWHVAFSNGYRVSWGPMFFERRPLLPDEEVP